MVRTQHSLQGRPDKAYHQHLCQLARLRAVVGYLGEKGQHNWWPSEFFSASATAFLNPVFTKTAALAQYHGVTEAARRVHDEHIGVGRVFHLFRLPESTEQALFELLQDAAMASDLLGNLPSQAAAQATLLEMAGASGELREGPVQIGSVIDLDAAGWMADAARCYEAAFSAGSRSFPYLTGGA